MVAYGEAWVDRDVRPDRCWRKPPSKGETGVQHGHRTRAYDLRIHRNHANLPGSSDNALLINASRLICKLAAGMNRVFRTGNTGIRAVATFQTARSRMRVP